MDVGPIRLRLVPRTLTAWPAYSIASSIRSVSVAGNGQLSPAFASRFSVRRTIDGVTPTRPAISLSPTPAVLKRSTSRTRRIVVLSAGIAPPVQKAKGAGPNRASRGLAYPSEIIPERRATSSWIRKRLPPESAPRVSSHHHGRHPGSTASSSIRSVGARETSSGDRQHLLAASHPTFLAPILGSTASPVARASLTQERKRESLRRTTARASCR